jgi:hypothetical protein
MIEDCRTKPWNPGTAPIAVIMIALNESHNMAEVCTNLSGWAQQVFLVDSYSKDDTVDIALAHGVHVVQRKFRGFGDQWNFALTELPISAPWTMKLDPDERLTEQLKASIEFAITSGHQAALAFKRRWWLLNRPLTTFDTVLRVWRTGSCTFTGVSVNEHPVVIGKTHLVDGWLEHHDSPDLEHWIDKQNRYSTAEAMNLYSGISLAERPILFGSNFQRRMWLKKHFYKIPMRYSLLFLYFWIYKGLWRSGWVGYSSARLWTHFFFVAECKFREMKELGRLYPPHSVGAGLPDPRVRQFD